MKKYVGIFLILASVFGFLYGQNTKIGFIEPHVILEECKIGKAAMTEMNQILKGWERQFETMEKAYKDKIGEFQTPMEEPPITFTDERKKEFQQNEENKKKKLLEEIQNMEMEMMRFEQSINGTAEKGGTDGLLMIKQNEILKPVLEQIEAVSTKFAITNTISLLLQDRPRNVSAYLDPSLEIQNFTEQIIKEMDKLPRK